MTRPIIERLRHDRECFTTYGVHDGHKLLELGTGWVHFESVAVALFYDVEAVLFDVRDNRRLNVIKLYAEQFDQVLDRELELTPAESARAHRVLKAIAAVTTFDELYALLHFRYLVEPSGTLHQFEDNSFDYIYSCSVLEHVQAGILPDYIRDIRRILQPGGYSIHEIDIADHLSMYVPSMSRKNYLRYSDKVWKRFFENDFQYFNRLQVPDWMCLFEQAGLELVQDERAYVDLDGLKVDPQYAHLDEDSLRCVDLRVVHRKPDEV